MKTIQWSLRSLLLGVAIATLFTNPSAPGNAQAATPATRPAALTPQTSEQGNVSVTVTPRSLAANVASWDFELTFSSHVQAVDQDLTKTVVLIDAAGQSHAPIGWDGDPPGGHHRKGVLHFKPLPGKPSTVELRVQGIGGVAVRTFRWRLE